MSLKIIGAGNGRTGTLSMKLALEQLGFGPCYHMYELMSDPERLPHWQDAFDGKPVDWEGLFDGYQSTMDYPGFYFYKEIMAAFPEAKVILTTRPGADWYESASKTIYKASPGPLQKLRILLRLPFNAKLRRVLPVFKIVDYLWEEVFEGRFADRDFAIRKFEAMNEEVIRTVPKEKLLVYQVKEGWEPLCDFLKLPVPDTPFPKTNHRDGFHAKLRRVRRGQLPLETLALERGVEV